MQRCGARKCIFFLTITATSTLYMNHNCDFFEIGKFRELGGESFDEVNATKKAAAKKKAAPKKIV